MITVSCWKWAVGDRSLFGPEYVNRLRAAVEKHLHIPHEFACVTDDARGLDHRVRVIPIPMRYAGTPRCRRRMQQFDRRWAERHNLERILNLDLDVVIVDDITPLVARPEPVVGWKVGYANVYSGSFLLFSAGALHTAWTMFDEEPEWFPLAAVGGKPTSQPPSDQAMLNHYLQASGRTIATVTEADGLVSYFGKGYERLERHGVGPNRTTLPAGARLVVLGSADKAVMDGGAYPWIREHWSALPGDASLVRFPGEDANEAQA